MVYLAEFVGTAILILLGNGVVAAVLLAKSKAENSGWVVIALGWGMAVAMAVYVVGSISGAHINPAVTLGLAVAGQHDWVLVPGYILAQIGGGIFGAVLVYLHYLKHWAVTEDANKKLACFSTAPEIRHYPANFLTEVIGTFMLVFGVLGIVGNIGAITDDGSAQVAVLFGTGIAPLIVGLLVLAIGLSLGGPTGYAINPARDLGPRIAHFLLPIPGKRDSDWSYSWVPVLGPVTGGILAGLVYPAIGLPL
jgi:glycerol uptake facilitator protein